MHQLASALINRFQKKIVLKGQMVKTLSCLLKNMVKWLCKSVATGQYTLVATLPTGYELAEEAPVISVVAGRNNNYRIGVISKVDLLAALNNQADVTKTAQYFNASTDKKEAYDQSFTIAQSSLTNKVSQGKSTKL